jgi:hypothetical protein
MKATERRFEIVEVPPNDPNHWSNFDLEEWVPNFSGVPI